MKAFLLLLLFSASVVFSQKQQKMPDDLFKEKIYASCKKKIIAYTLKDFDALFFEFFKKQNDQNLVLSKEEFYNYTVQIAAFSDRLAALYPNRKAEADESKKLWMAKTYDDYLKSKPLKK